MAAGGFQIYPVPKVPRYRNSADAENVMMSRLVTEAPRRPWDYFTRNVLDWRYGEPFSLIGPTGQGKTTMLRALIPFHRYVAVFATKPRDDAMDALIHGAIEQVKTRKSLASEECKRRVQGTGSSHIA